MRRQPASPPQPPPGNTGGRTARPAPGYAGRPGAQVPPRQLRPRTPAGRAEPGPGTRAPRPAGSRGSGIAIRLTGRGAVLSLFGLTFIGLLLANWMGWGMLGDVTFVIACILIVAYAKPSDLLTVVVCPPLVFLGACVCAKVITSAGGTSAAEGTLVTLGNSAPWLFIGTILTIVIALSRGLLDNIRELRQGLRGEPGTQARDDAGAARNAFGPARPRR